VLSCDRLLDWLELLDLREPELPLTSAMNPRLALGESASPLPAPPCKATLGLESGSPNLPQPESSRNIPDRSTPSLTLHQYERIVSATSDAIALIDIHYCYLVVNQAYLDRHNTTHEAIIGQPLWSVLGEDLFEAVVKPYFDRCLMGETVQYQFWFDHPRLGWRFSSVTHSPFCESDGSVWGVVANIRDLTELKRAEEALRQQIQQDQALNQVIQTMRNSLELEHIFEVATREVAQLLGTVDTAIYRYDCDLGFWSRQASQVCYRLHHPQPLLEISETNNPISDRLKRGERVLITQGANLHCATNDPQAMGESRCQILIPLIVSGQVWGSFCTTIASNLQSDLDEKIKVLERFTAQLAIAIQQSQLYQQVHTLNRTLEHQVQERTAQLERALAVEALTRRITTEIRQSIDESQIVDIAVQGLGNQLGVLFCNAVRYDQNPKGEATYTVIASYDNILPELLNLTLATDKFPDAIPQLLRGEWVQFCTVIEASGLAWRSVLICPMVDDQGLMLGDMLLLRPKEQCFDALDVQLVQQVTDQCAIAIRQARLYRASQAQVEELTALHELKDDFLSTVSHELRSPVANMKMAVRMLALTLGQSDLLDHDCATLPPSSDRTQQYLHILDRECDREISLINDLLDLQRLDTGSHSFAWELVDLPGLLSSLASTFQERAESRRQTLDYRCDPALGLIYSDITALNRVLSELLHNACKYTPPGELIQLRATPQSDRVQFCVTNYGVEIPPELLPRIFERFYRVPQSDRWQQGGTGLGLALVKRLVEGLNGTITAESQESYTRFTIELPLQEPDITSLST